MRSVACASDTGLDWFYLQLNDDPRREHTMKRTAVILGIATAMGVFVPLAAGSSNHDGVTLQWGTGARPVYVVSTSQAPQYRASGPRFELHWGDGGPPYLVQIDPD
jgi:hypothetical protein